MSAPLHPDVSVVLEGFGLPGTTPISAVPGGHVNLSYRLVADRGPLLLQRINPLVFQNGAVVLLNASSVTAHLDWHVRREGFGDASRRVARPVPAATGAPGVRAADGAWWRLVEWIPDTRVMLQVSTPVEAREIGAAFGRFLRWMSDYAGPPLVPAIAGFHDTEASLARFDAAVQRDAAGRAGEVKPEITAIREAGELAGALNKEKLPRRIIHADAKPANVLLDSGTGEALAVIDLDTVMQGSLLLDIGDLIRSAACAVAEDDPNPTGATLDEALFDALLRGLAAGLAPMRLEPAERRLVLTAARVIVHEQAARFLTDYLHGDRYYRIARPGQNLDRARVQLRLLGELVEAGPRLQTLIAAALPV